MRTYRRRRQQYLFASLLGVIGVVNLLFFLILYRPIRSEHVRLQDSIEKNRQEIQSRRQKIDRLEKLSAQLEISEQDRRKLVATRFIPKNSGWSEIIPQLDTMIQGAAVKNSRKEFSLEEAPQFGLQSVKMRLPVSGSYSNVVNLIKRIENAHTFFIIDSIDVRGNTGPGASEVSMNLNLETFFYQ
jgi:type IV pilus assembly PilO-like protein